MTNDYHHLPEKVKPPGIVPWFGKIWPDIQRDHMAQLEQHLEELAAERGQARADQYLNYLKGLK